MPNFTDSFRMQDADVWRQRFKRYPRVVLETMLAQLTISPGGDSLPAMLDELNEVWRGLRPQGRAQRPHDDAPEYGTTRRLAGGASKSGKEAHGTSRKAGPETVN
jgi:hypothetical protein